MSLKRIFHHEYKFEIVTSKLGSVWPRLSTAKVRLHENACQWSRHFRQKPRVRSWRGGWHELFGIKNRQWKWPNTAISKSWSFSSPMCMADAATLAIGPPLSYLGVSTVSESNWPACVGRKSIKRRCAMGEVEERKREFRGSKEKGRRRRWWHGSSPLGSF